MIFQDRNLFANDGSGASSDGSDAETHIDYFDTEEVNLAGAGMRTLIVVSSSPLMWDPHAGRVARLRAAARDAAALSARDAALAGSVKTFRI